MYQLLATLLLGLAAYWTLLFLTQRRILFPAPIAADAPRLPPTAREVRLPGREGETEAWYLPPLVSAGGPVPLLLFAHGNGELIDYWPDEFDEPRRWGVAVLLVEYPGYGRSAGSPSQSSIRQTFLAAYDWAVSETGIDATRVVGYGRSLGGGAIGLLMRERPLAAVVLESAFTSTRPFALRFGAPPFLVRDPFDTMDAVRSFAHPLLVLHGEHDEVIPVRHGRRLADAGGVDLHLLPCGHNDCPRSWKVVHTFLEQAGIL